MAILLPLNPEMTGGTISAKSLCTHHHHQFENMFITSKEMGVQDCSSTPASSCLCGQICRPWDSPAPPVLWRSLQQNSIHSSKLLTFIPRGTSHQFLSQRTVVWPYLEATSHCTDTNTRAGNMLSAHQSGNSQHLHIEGHQQPKQWVSYNIQLPAKLGHS